MVLNAYPELPALLEGLNSICLARGMGGADIIDAYIDFDDEILAFEMRYIPNRNIGFLFPVFFDFHLLIEEGIQYINLMIDNERKRHANDN